MAIILIQFATFKLAVYDRPFGCTTEVDGVNFIHIKRFIGVRVHGHYFTPSQTSSRNFIVWKQ